MGRRHLPRVTRVASASLLFSVMLSCGGAPFPRETFASNARTDDTWLEGQRCGPLSSNVAGLRIEEIAAGPGKVVGDGDTVRVHYVARLADGTTVHDTEPDTPPIEIIIGSTKVICGFEKALLGMHAGAQRRVFVPSRLAFGDAGKPPTVPPGSDLSFVIDLYVPAEPTNEQRSAPVKPAGGGRGGGGAGRPGH